MSTIAGPDYATALRSARRLRSPKGYTMTEHIEFRGQKLEVVDGDVDHDVLTLVARRLQEAHSHLLECQAGDIWHPADSYSAQVLCRELCGWWPEYHVAELTARDTGRYVNDYPEAEVEVLLSSKQAMVRLVFVENFYWHGGECSGSRMVNTYLREVSIGGWVVASYPGYRAMQEEILEVAGKMTAATMGDFYTALGARLCEKYEFVRYSSGDTRIKEGEALSFKVTDRETGEIRWFILFPNCTLGTAIA